MEIQHISNVSVYNTLDVHCQSPCSLSMRGFSRDWQCQIRSFAPTGEHGINSMSYDTIKSKPLVFSGVQEPHMNSSLKDQMSSSLSPQKSGFGLDLLLKTVICSNEVLWRLSYCPWGLLCHMYSKFMASKVALVKKDMLKDQQRWGSIALTTLWQHCFPTLVLCLASLICRTD